MAIFKVLEKFKDKKTKKVHDKNEEVEMTVKRADEINGSDYNIKFLERLDNKK